jgi:hypothetical protein
MTGIPLSARQESFSLAYVRAVVATAGFALQGGSEPDLDSVDLTISARGNGGVFRSPRLDIQLKCQLNPTGGDPWVYDLKAKNFNDLVPSNPQVPRILVVVQVPTDPALWLDHNEERLLMRHCGWWVSLRGLPETTNTSTQRIQIPRLQHFNEPQLIGIMDRIGQGGMP